MNNNSYSVFCIASILLRHDPHHYDTLDGCWEKAHELYKEFDASKFNDLTTSELDGINAFMESKGYMPKCSIRSAFIWSEEDVDAQAYGHRNEHLVEAMSVADKLNLLEHAIDQAEDAVMEIINQSICDAISELTNP